MGSGMALSSSRSLPQFCISCFPCCYEQMFKRSNLTGYILAYNSKGYIAHGGRIMRYCMYLHIYYMYVMLYAQSETERDEC